MPLARLSLAALCLVVLTPAGAAARTADGSSVQGPQIIDRNRRMDINLLNMWTTNFGTIAWDLNTGNSGLEFPRGSGKTAIFAGGLWLGARVNGQTRTVVAEYSQEYGPGPMVGGGPSPDTQLAQFRVYKVLSWSGDPADTGHVDRATPGALEDPLAHDSWSSYLAGAAPYGAPVQTWLLPDPNNPGGTIPVLGPADLGRQMLWAVYNDAEPSLHTNDAGNSQPLGLEIQQLVVGANGVGALENSAVIRYRLIHKGAQQLDDMIIALWTDPDLGGASDDLVGSDPGLELVYAYNANNNDQLYGSTPPAVGVVLLAGPRTALGDTIPAAAAVKFINGTDPASTAETYKYMRGLNANGSAIIDPLTSTVKTFMHDGDPVQSTGWIDSNPADRRMLLSTGTFSMAPGDTQEVVFGIVMGQGANRLSSITVLKANVNQLKNGIAPPPPPPPTTNCPRPVAYWATQCPPGSGELTPAQLQSIATLAGFQSLLFDWASGSEATALCSAIIPPGPLNSRSIATTEYAALMANWAAGVAGIEPPGGQPIRLLQGMPVNCPGIPATTLGQLVQTATHRASLEAAYLDDNPAHRRALTGVNWGGTSFFGGADFAYVFGGNGPDPSASPDSFVNVELRFSQSTTQSGYRYLRLEKADGSPPAGGRAYRYGGFHEVPFQVWDIDHGVQLDVAFVERAVTDAFGTLLPPGAQVATFDSTWQPSADGVGGREYLTVLARPYSGTPKAEFQQDGKFFDPAMPGMYTLWSALRSSADVIDDGDRMQFLTEPYSGLGVDTRLLILEGKPLGSPSVQAAYDQIIECLRDINQGITIENPCEQPTAVQLSLLSVEVNEDRVELTWHTPSAALAVWVERREEAGEWGTVAEMAADASGLIRYVDTDIVPGRRYAYRLAFMDDGVFARAGETNLVVPARLQLALSGFVPNPARGRAIIEFVLPERAPATLEVLDLQGRRVASRAVGHLGPGRAAVSLAADETPGPGIYVIRLRQGDVRVSRKAVMVR